MYYKARSDFAGRFINKNVNKKILLFFVFVIIVGNVQAFVSKAAKPLDREILLEGMKPYWGNGPNEDDIVDPDVKIISEKDMGDHIRRHISYMVEDDDKAFAYILLPKPLPTKEKPVAAVLCPHPTTGIGKDMVCGIHSHPPADAEEAEQWAQRAYALDLVRLGYVAFAPDQAGYGERVTIDQPITTQNQEHVEAFRKQWLKKWPNAKFYHYKQLWDIQRAIDVVCELDFVDNNKIGIIGHSLGAWGVVFASAHDTRIKAAVSNASGSMRFIPKLWTDNEALKKYLSNIKSQTFESNMNDLRTNINVWIMLTAPRAFLFIKPYHDLVKDEQQWSNQLEGFRVILDYYRQVAGGDEDYKAPFSIYFHDQRHSFEQEARLLAYGWLDKYLRGNLSYIRKFNTYSAGEE